MEIMETANIGHEGSECSTAILSSSRDLALTSLHGEHIDGQGSNNMKVELCTLICLDTVYRKGGGRVEQTRD